MLWKILGFRTLVRFLPRSRSEEMVRGKALKEAEPEFSVLLNKKYAEKILKVCTYFYLCKYLADVLDQSRVCCSKLFHSVGPFEVCNLLLAWPFSYYVFFFFSISEKGRRIISIFSRWFVLLLSVSTFCGIVTKLLIRRQNVCSKPLASFCLVDLPSFGCLILQCWGCFKEGWLVGKFIVLYTFLNVPNK